MTIRRADGGDGVCIGWHLFQTNVVQALLHGSLDDVDLYIELPARYACPAGYVLKLRKAIYGLHPAVKFKQEVLAWFLANGYMPAHDSETFWIKMVPVKLNWGGVDCIWRSESACFVR